MVSASRVAEHGRRAGTGASGLLVLVMSVLGLGMWAGWWLPLEVQGGSMQPTISNGSLVVTTPAEIDEIGAGDVISFIGQDGKRVTHRVVAIDESTGEVTTRGDANAVDDATPYTGHHVDLVFFAIPGLGVALRVFAVLMTNPWTIAGLVVALAVVALPWPGRRRGRHVRGTAAVKTAAAAATFNDHVQIGVLDAASLEVEGVNGASVLELMQLGATQGRSLEVSVTGPQARVAVGS